MKVMIVIILFILLIVGGVLYLSVDRNQTPVNEQVEQISLPLQEGLPEAVEAKRQAIYAAANERNYEKLAALAEPNLSYSFGGPYEGGFVEYLKLAEKDERMSAFDIIPKLLVLPYAFKDGRYVWPSVFYKAPAEWTEADLEIMRSLVSEETIEQYREFGGYVFYRLGITTDGKWTFYIAGD